jgi:hypothetical protein
MLQDCILEFKKNESEVLNWQNVDLESLDTLRKVQKHKIIALLRQKDPKEIRYLYDEVIKGLNQVQFEYSLSIK